MNTEETRRQIEKLLKNVPEMPTPAQVHNWSPYGRATIYRMLVCGEIKSADEISFDFSSAFYYSVLKMLIFSFFSKNAYATSDTIPCLLYQILIFVI